MKGPGVALQLLILVLSLATASTAEEDPHHKPVIILRLLQDSGNAYHKPIMQARLAQDSEGRLVLLDESERGSAGPSSRPGDELAQDSEGRLVPLDESERGSGGPSSRPGDEVAQDSEGRLVPLDESERGPAAPSSRPGDEVVSGDTDLGLYTTDIEQIWTRPGPAGYEVAVDLSRTGSDKVREFTRANMGNEIAVIVGGKVTVTAVIGTELSRDFPLAIGLTKREAQEMAGLLGRRTGGAVGKRKARGAPSRLARPLVAVLVYALVSCMTVLLLSRRRWLVGGMVAPCAASIYRIGQGIYWQLTLPSAEEYQRQLRENMANPATRILTTINVLFNRSMHRAPGWAAISMIAAVEIGQAVIGSLLGLGVALLLLRARQAPSSGPTAPHTPTAPPPGDNAKDTSQEGDEDEPATRAGRQRGKPPPRP